ncbi:MAG: hypothetical protein H7235_02090 [Bdellovibrionaceae bacterium]|nr:hypothetical protein [Pseudobdellovibrionaceae bacterium]
MKLFKFLCCFILTLSGLSCTTTQIVEKREADLRTPSSVMRCKNLFEQKTTIDKATLDETKNKIVSRLEFVSKLLPTAATDVFWDTVVELSNNNDSKIHLESHGLVLTKNYNSTLKIHSTYNYDTPSNSFLISKLEYSTSGIKRQLISESPIDPATNKFKTDLFLEIESATLDHGSINIAEHIDYKVYEKIADEIAHLNYFTTYELNKLYTMSPAARSLKYSYLSHARSLRKFFTANILNDYLFAPVKYIAVSFVSIFIISHIDFVKNTLSKTNHTPNWVAPAVVKMAVAYPKKVQPELVTLIKRIEYQEKSENIEASKVQMLGQNKDDLVQIDEADQFSIEVEPRTKKTYFFVSHQKESGSIDIYATEINPAHYPNLISYFIHENK